VLCTKPTHGAGVSSLKHQSQVEMILHLNTLHLHLNISM